MALQEYARKRDFGITPEPKAKIERRTKGCRFVIQKHEASRLHYDFRLEMDGVLKSWAVPKGVPFVHGEKRLAMQTEDHPVAYIDFEGTIPKGEYGGGTVMVWDYGEYEPLSKTPSKELAGGKLHFVLRGKKLDGEWYLVRLREKGEWLLIRGGEDLPKLSARKEDSSALSGKSMKTLSKSGKVWKSKPEKSKETKASQKRAKTEPKKKRTEQPAFIEPMKAKLSTTPPPGEWQWEIKFDGFRALAIKAGHKTSLISRNQKDLGAKFPAVLESLRGLKNDAILDGEIVALDNKGRSSFQLLQAYELGEERPPLFYYAFDLLHSDGEDLTALPLEERQERLSVLLKDPLGIFRLSPVLGNDVESLLEQAGKLGLEGLIGKRKGSLYEPGKRSGAWVKLKLLQEQEFIIGGYTEPDGTRKHLGALLIGVYEKGELLCTGKVGTGFTEKLLQVLHAKFKKFATEVCPFANLPAKRAGRWGQGITAAEMKRCHWLKPTLVCQVRFSEWTRDGRLRQPVFVGLREDKKPAEVIREKAS